MQPRLLLCTSLILAAAILAPGLRAQQNDSGGQNPPPAQAASSAPAAPDTTAAPPKSEAPEKKVWTNEEMSKMDPHSGVSTVGKEDRNAPSLKPSGVRRDAKWYQSEILKMREKVANLDKQIAEIDAALAGNPTGDQKKSARPTGVKSDDLHDERARFNFQRDELLDKIAALQDEARHNGVDPNQLP
jgi:hypothetical protein